MEVYVIAIQEGGSGVITSSEAFLKYSDAEAALAKDRARGINYTRIFTLRPK